MDRSSISSILLAARWDDAPRHKILNERLALADGMGIQPRSKAFAVSATLLDDSHFRNRMPTAPRQTSLLAARF